MSRTLAPTFPLPTPYTDSTYLGRRTIGASLSVLPAAAVWPANNRAIYVPFTVPCPAYATQVRAIGTNTTGNYDIGIYNYLGALISAKGTTALAAALLTHTVAVPLLPGQTYYLALVLSSTSGTAVQVGFNGVGAAQSAGLLQEALGGTTLPANMTPAVATSDNFPVMGVALA